MRVKELLKAFSSLYRYPPYLPSTIFSNKEKYNGCLLKKRQLFFIAYPSVLQSERAAEAEKCMRQNQMDDLRILGSVLDKNQKDLTLFYMTYCINFYTAHVLSKIKSIRMKAMSCTDLISMPYWSLTLSLLSVKIFKIFWNVSKFSMRSQINSQITISEND